MSDLSMWYRCDCGIATNYQPNNDTLCLRYDGGHKWVPIPAEEQRHEWEMVTASERDSAIARAERAEAEVTRLREVLDSLERHLLDGDDTALALIDKTRAALADSKKVDEGGVRHG